MFAFIKKLKSKDKDKEHVNRMIKIFATISTLIIVIAWLILLSFLPNRKEVDAPVLDPNAPDFDAFLQESGTQLNNLFDGFNETRTDLVKIKQEINETESKVLLDEERQIIDNIN